MIEEMLGDVAQNADVGLNLVEIDPDGPHKAGALSVDRRVRSIGRGEFGRGDRTGRR